MFSREAVTRFLENMLVVERVRTFSNPGCQTTPVSPLTPAEALADHLKHGTGHLAIEETSAARRIARPATPDTLPVVVFNAPPKAA